MKSSPNYPFLLAILFVCLYFSSCNKHPLEQEQIIDQQEIVYDLEPAYDREETNDLRTKPPLDVYLIMGQSNAVGAGIANSADNYNPWLINSFSPILFASRTSNQYWSTDPFFLPWGPLQARHPSSKDGFGCEMSFGKRLYINKPDYANNSRKLAIIKSAVGSTALFPRLGIHSWDTKLSDNSIIYINARINQLKHHGYTDIQIKGLIWIHGETDVAAQPHVIDQYPQKFVQMVDKIHNRINGTNNMQVVMVGLNRSSLAWKSKNPGWSNLNKFNAKLNALANSKPDYHYVSANYLEMINDTDIHYNGDGQLLLGFRLAQEFY